DTVATTGSVNGVYFAKKFGFSNAASDLRAILDSETINLVVVATRHDSHSRLAIEAISAGKHVLVEKPLAISMEELLKVEAAMVTNKASNASSTLTVGFNRRFSPLVVTASRLLSDRRGPKSFSYTVNAGPVPADH